MITTTQVQDLLQNGGNVVNQDGSKIGGIGQVFLDDHSGEPEWVTVKTGLFGGAESFVPLTSAEVRGNDIVVPFDKDKVKGAPRVQDADGHLDENEERELFSYYGVGQGGYTEGTRGTDTHVTGDRTGENFASDTTRGAGHDTSGPNTDDAMTRSEERVDIGTEKVATGKARLRKYVVTENVTKTVPVTHEEVRVEREPITEANRDQALSGGDLTSEEHEVELTEERVVVNKETVPVERVRLDKETVTEEQRVDEEVRKEQIETEGAADVNGPGTGSRS
ncbi:MAG: hypothetical protein JWR20_1443 [Marmoricola sp.]|nr:hypothetical protein [Marmoricola sp.]